MDLTYTPATAADAQAIFELSRALILNYEDPKAIDLDRVLQWMRRKIETHIGQYTCILRRGEKAGYFRFCPQDGQMELDDLYILPEFQNRGIGTAVVKKCCAESDRPIFLCVFTRNTGAIALYRRLGFEITEEISATRCLMRREVL